MAKLKLKKYPKAPKKSASIATKESYISRCREIDKENAKRKADMKKSESLSNQIAAMRRR